MVPDLLLQAMMLPRQGGQAVDTVCHCKPHDSIHFVDIEALSLSPPLCGARPDEPRCSNAMFVYMSFDMAGLPTLYGVVARLGMRDAQGQGRRPLITAEIVSARNEPDNGIIHPYKESAEIQTSRSLFWQQWCIPNSVVSLDVSILLANANATSPLTPNVASLSCHYSVSTKYDRTVIQGRDS